MEKSSRPLHLQIIDDLRHKIASGVYQPGDQLPTEEQMAHNLGVSRGTVRQALQSMASDGLIERIQGKGSFISSPSVHPVGFAARSRLVGFVVPSLRDHLSNEMINGAERILRQAGYSLVFCHSDHELEVERAQVVQLLNQRVSGIILFPLVLPGEEKIIHMIQEEGVPVVLVDRHIQGTPIPTVQADNFHGGYLATSHLLDLGHRRVVCVSNSAVLSSVTQRVAGYEQAMRDAGLLPFAAIPLLGPSTMLADAAPPEISDEEFRLVEHMLRVENRPTALFCINDFAAIGVMRRLLSRGIRIPGDIAMVGFDDSPFAHFAPIPLTSVSQPAIEIGARAAEVMLARIEGQDVDNQPLLLPTSLVVRASSVQEANGSTYGY